MAIYSNAFFITEPDKTPFQWGEIKTFPTFYVLGSPNVTKPFRLVWYANRLDANSRRNPLTEISKLPTHTFYPRRPKSGIDVIADEIQRGVVLILRPSTPQTGDYANPIPVIFMDQDTQFPRPYAYTTEDHLEIYPGETKNLDFYYNIQQKSESFMIEWYKNRLDSIRRIDAIPASTAPTTKLEPTHPIQSLDDTEIFKGTLNVSAPANSPANYFAGKICFEVDREIICPDALIWYRTSNQDCPDTRESIPEKKSETIPSAGEKDTEKGRESTDGKTTPLPSNPNIQQGWTR